MSHWSSCFGLMIVLSLYAAGSAAADDASGAEAERASESARIRVGIAPFEVAAPSGVAVPDYATLLADLLGTRAR